MNTLYAYQTAMTPNVEARAYRIVEIFNALSMNVYDPADTFMLINVTYNPTSNQLTLTNAKNSFPKALVERLAIEAEALADIVSVITPASYGYTPELASMLHIQTNGFVFTLRDIVPVTA